MALYVSPGIFREVRTNSSCGENAAMFEVQGLLPRLVDLKAPEDGADAPDEQNINSKYIQAPSNSPNTIISPSRTSAASRPLLPAAQSLLFTTSASPF